MKLALQVGRLGFQGGLERHAYDLGRALRGRGHEVRLLHGEETGRDAALFSAAFSQVFALGAPGALRGLDAVWVEKARSLDDLSALGDLPVVLAVHDHDLTCARTARLRPPLRGPCHRAPGVSCLLTCALVRERRPGALPLRLVNALSLPGRLRALARRGQLIACSSYLARTLVEAGAPAERVSVLHPVPPEPAQPMQPRPRERRLLVAAQLVHGKGVDLAIHALRFLPDDISLNVVGDGPDRARLERLALPFGRRVKFDGYVPAERMQAMYDSCRAALVPSRWPEPFGLCGVEAMRRARPAVGAAHGGILEWLAPGAGFVPENVHDLARAALEALDDDTAGDRSLGFVRTRFPEGGAVQAAESALAAAASSSTAAP